jgi:capsular exopolysaccharide synthesis family protein
MDDRSDLDLAGPSPAAGAPVRAAVGPAPVGADVRGGYPPTLTPATQFDPRHLLDYVRILYRRRWTAVSAFLLVTIASTVYTYTRVPIYQANARLLVSVQRQTFGVKDLAESEALQNYLQTQYAILQSRSLAKSTLQKMGAWRDVKASPQQVQKPVEPPAPAWRKWDVVFFVRAFFTDLTGWPGTGRPPISVPGAAETMAEARQIDGFLGGLRIAPVGGSSLVDVTYVSLDPATAARHANALAQAYVDENLAGKSTLSQEASDWLSARVEEQRTLVGTSQEALRRYQAQNQGVSVDGQNSAVQAVVEITTALTRARTDRIEKESRYTQFRSIQNDPAALESFAPVALNPGVQQAKNDVADKQVDLSRLSEQLGEKNPRLVDARRAIKTAEDRLQMEFNRVATTLRTDVETAKANETGLVRTLDAQRRQALGAGNRSGIELAVLQRDVESNRQVYDTLTARLKETGLSSELKTNNVRILDRAEIPRGSIWPNTRRNIQYGVVGGMLIAIGLVFFFEYLDNRIKSPDEIKSHLGLPFLGLIPSIGKAQVTGTPLLNDGVPSNFVEAFRGIRTNVMFSIPGDVGAHSLLVTSAEPSEGKTVVASNLAISVAQAGQRVLLIDGDLRRPRLHDVFGIAQEPGLSNFLVGEAKAADVIRKGPVPNLWVLPSGHVPPNPAELLGSRRFKEFLRRLDDHFDWVIVDTPPVMAVTDAAVVAHSVSRVLFVACAEMTNRHSARQAIEQIEGTHGHFLGAVLNKVDLDRNAYYYSRYYRRGYHHYYGQSSSEKKKKKS